MNAESPLTLSHESLTRSADEQRRARLFRFAVSLCVNREVAEDLTQEAWLRWMQHTNQFGSIRNVEAWLFRVIRNLWIDRCRRESVRASDGAIDIDALAGWNTMPSELMSRREELAESLRAMMELPERQREVLYLHAVEQMSIDEISQTLETSRTNVKASLSLARKRMRERLQSRKSDES